MKRKVYSPVVIASENGVTKIMHQIYKLPDGQKVVFRFDEVSLIQQENKLINSLSPEDIRYLIDSIGNNPPVDLSKQLPDDVLMQIVSSRRIQEPSIMKRHIESAFAAYKEGKQTYEEALLSFKKGDYIHESTVDSKTD